MNRELGHIANGDMGKQSSLIDGEDDSSEREEAANQYAKDALIDPVSFDLFVQKKDFGINSIRKFANAQGVPDYIVIGRLQHEEIIPWDRYSKYKVMYKWMTEEEHFS